MFDFPSSPAVDQLHAQHGVAYRWDGIAWLFLGAYTPPAIANAQDRVMAQFVEIIEHSGSYARIIAQSIEIITNANP